MINALKKYSEKIKPAFQKGGKYERFNKSFEAFETLLFVQDKVTQKGSHIRDPIDMKRTMIIVVIALIPPLLFGCWNTGHQYALATGQALNFLDAFGFGFLKILPILAVSYTTGLFIEFLFSEIRGHVVSEGFFVSGMLIALIMPVNVPLWMVAVSTAFAVIFGKEIFGGTGMNIWNPALLTRAFLFLAYPVFMSGDKVWIAGMLKGEQIDAFSGATPLGQVAEGSTQIVNGLGQDYSFFDMFLGTIPGSIGETSTLAILIGACILLYTRIASWRIIVSVVLGGLSMGLLLNAVAVNPFMALPAHYHLVLGGFAFGAVYMATDPVSASQTNKGKWIYGFLVGFMSILIRVLNPAYPEGVMLAILLMNTFAPLIDHYIIQANIRRRMKRAMYKPKNI
jgi:Na+-transporting NADH:ubiquinone oxidoreductase subunit B